MYAHIIRRLFYMVIVLFIMSAVIFFLMSMVTEDPVVMMLGQAADPETVQKLHEQLGLDRPLIVQYLDWLQHVVRGDFGESYTMPMNTIDLILQRLPLTIELTFLAILLALIVAIPLGVFSALRFKSKSDIAIQITATAGISMPNFWIGILLIFIVALKLKWLPASGWVPFFEDPLENLRLMILPVLTLSAWYTSVYVLFTRSTFIEALRSDYIMVARSKGILERRVLWLHAFKNTLIPLVTMVGVNVSGLFGGAVVTETIFALPGLGRLLVDSMLSRDMPLMMGTILFITAIVVVCNLLVDLIYVMIDPRIRFN